MKQKIKTIIYRAIAVAIFIAMILASIILGWEMVRPTVVSKFEKEEIVTPKEEPTEFEMYVASKEVQEELGLMWKRHQRDELNKEITELETSKR